MADQTAIYDYLSSKGIYSGDPERRRGMAEKLAAYGMELGTLTAVWGACVASSKDQDKVRGLFVFKLKDPAAAVAMADDIEQQETLTAAQNAGGTSSMEFVSDSNPYGWSNKNFLKQLDHNIPDEWNAYRQDYNLTEQERSAAGQSDYRKTGCTRVEAAGASSRSFGSILHGVAQKARI